MLWDLWDKPPIACDGFLEVGFRDVLKVAIPVREELNDKKGDLGSYRHEGGSLSQGPFLSPRYSTAPV